MPRADELIALEEQARGGSRPIFARDELVAIVAHELKAPLVAIGLGATSLLEEPALVDAAPDSRELIELMERSATHLTRLVDDLLDADRIARRALGLRLAPTHLGPLVADAAALYHHIARPRSIRLRASIPRRLPTVVCDGDRVAQALSNLVSNAVKFTPRGGEVEVAIRAEGDGVGISVRDTGVGITDDAISQIFERFTQGARDRRGLGLGLYIARSIIEAHGAALTVASRPGRGTTFAFQLPHGPHPTA